MLQPARTYLLTLSLFMAAAGRLWAQGGPPMLTDDPGTPGANKWELNFGWTTESTPGSTLTALPQVDLNYGIGERVELTYFANYYNLRTSDGGSSSGISDSELAVKWRFFDNGEGGTQASIYPQVTFLTPGSHSDQHGLASGNTSYQLPIEFEEDLKVVSVDVDFGHSFATGSDADGWFGGVCVGRELRKGWDVDGEVHVETDARADHGEVIANVATRIDLSEHYTLMLLVGRDLSNGIGPRASLMSYVGIQVRI